MESEKEDTQRMESIDSKTNRELKEPVIFPIGKVNGDVFKLSLC